jgi:hypothetical protein
MKSHERKAAKAVTARPRALRDAGEDNTEEGLSIDPEQMGQSFLRYATQPGASAPDGLPELYADGAAASDRAEEGSHFSSDASIWENTANAALEYGSIDEVTGEAVPPPLDDDQEMGEPSERGVVEVDLTESVIDEASLLDEESDVLGEVVPKQPRTEDTGPARRAQDDDDD